MSCEQAADATSADARSDLYSLGATLYHLLTGEVPFPGETATEVAEKKLTGKYEPASALNPEVPATLDRIVGLLLAKDPRDRYQTASELILDLVRTNLAPPVPSFVDDAVALADPELRERLESSEPTRPDLQAAESKPSEPPIDPEVWYLRYEEGDGKWCKTKATTAEIVERIRTGKARGTDQVCHRALGAFQPLSEWPVFARALAEREEAVRAERAQSESPPVAPRRWPGYSAIGLAALALVVGAAVLVWLLS
jgi:serine/threonine-protein kinase